MKDGVRNNYIIKKHFDKLSETKHYADLKAEVGRNKKLAHGYGLAALLALRNYPQLHDARVEFTFGSNTVALSTRPTLATTLLPGVDRLYRITIGTDSRPELRHVLMKNLSFNMQVGQFGHELGHVVDFIAKNSLEVLADGVFYFVPALKEKLESSTDMMALRHGFGYQMLEFARLIEKLAGKYPDEKYYTSYFDYYLSPGEIQQQISKLKIYSSIKS